MGDRSAMTMVLGGKINSQKLRDLCAEYDVSSEFGDADADPWDEREDTDGIRLVIEESDISGGVREDFEAALVEMGIPFDRHSDACGGVYPGSCAYHRPGYTDRFKSYLDTEGVYEALAMDDDDEPCLKLSDVRKHLKAGDLVAWLDKRHPEIPELPPVTWTDEEDEKQAARETFEEHSG